jgi:cell division cycle 14
VPVICFSIDATLVYWNFFSDFGPLNLGQLYRFTTQLNDLLTKANNTTVTSNGERPAVLFYSSCSPAKRTNAIYLMCAWQVLELNRTPEQAFYGFSYYAKGAMGNVPPTAQSTSLPPPYPLTTIGQATVALLPTFHDASPVACNYNLNLMHCLQGLKKAREFGFFSWDSFDVEEYEYYEQVEVRAPSNTSVKTVEETRRLIPILFFLSSVRMAT